VVPWKDVPSKLTEVTQKHWTFFLVSPSLLDPRKNKCHTHQIQAKTVSVPVHLLTLRRKGFMLNGRPFLMDEKHTKVFEEDIDGSVDIQRAFRSWQYQRQRYDL
jgi:hypothetical protein